MKRKILTFAAVFGVLLGAWMYAGTAIASATETPTPTVSVSATPEPALRAAGCHPHYVQCLDPAHGDWDCSEIPANKKPVQLKSPTNDEYQLDDDNDGWGCEVDGTKAPPTTTKPVTKKPTASATASRTTAPPVAGEMPTLPRTGSKTLGVLCVAGVLIVGGAGLWWLSTRLGRGRSTRG